MVYKLMGGLESRPSNGRINLDAIYDTSRLRRKLQVSSFLPTKALNEYKLLSHCDIASEIVFVEGIWYAFRLYLVIIPAR